MFLQSVPIPTVLLIEKRLNNKPNHRGHLCHISWEDTMFLCLLFHFLRNVNKSFLLTLGERNVHKQVFIVNNVILWWKVHIAPDAALSAVLLGKVWSVQ